MPAYVTNPPPQKLDLAFIYHRLASVRMAGIPFFSFVSYIASGFIIFGGILPYIPQYLQIRQTKNAEGFSLFVCFTLLVANTLRIFFWFGHPFETPLLVQSVVMIIAMFLMIQLCTSVKHKTEIIASKLHQFSDFDWQYFWRWTDFSSYVQCMLVVSLVVGLVTTGLLDWPLYVEGLGLLAVLSEAMLGAPQFYANLVNKSTKGMSVKMVFLWLAGDVFKTAYFITRSAPLQFWLCGLLQIGLDVAILLQVVLYAQHPNSH